MRCEMVDADSLGISLYGGPDNVGGYPKSQFGPVFPDVNGLPSKASPGGFGLRAVSSAP
jgi:hypothetical protein